VSFYEIREHVYGLIADDATFKTLTGATASDKRIYYQFPPERIEISDSKPAYIVYSTEFFEAIEAMEHVTGQRPPITFSFVIWAKDPQKLDQIFLRLFDIPIEVKAFNTATYRITAFRYLEGGDFPVDHEITRLYHRVVRWKAERVYKL